MRKQIKIRCIKADLQLLSIAFSKGKLSESEFIKRHNELVTELNTLEANK